MTAFQSMKRLRDDSASDDERSSKVRSRSVSVIKTSSHTDSPKKSRFWATLHPRNGATDCLSRPKFPFRPALPPSPPQTSDLEALPAQSDPRDPNSPASFEQDPSEHFSYYRANSDDGMDLDGDDENDDIICSPVLTSPMTQTFRSPMRPAKLNSNLFGRDSDANTGRLPTPMYPSFHAPRNSINMSGNGALGYPSSSMAGGTGNTFLGVNSVPILRTPPMPSKQSQIDEDRSRRLPSPISEDEDYPDTPTGLTSSQLSRLSVTPIVEQMDEAMDEDHPPPGVVTTPSRGRKRSGALSGKGRFLMGYRDDCEKCRQRVPGHYSHFLP